MVVIGWFTLVDEADLLYEGLKAVLEVTVSSPSAAAAKEVASCLLEQCGRPNYSEFSSFAIKFIKELKSCFVEWSSFKLTKEAMWGTYHQLRTSTAFVKLWNTFVAESIERKASPVFFQHVTSVVFGQLVRSKYHFDADTAETNNSRLTYQEENILRYIAGYVCRRVKMKLESPKRKGKDAMILCIMELSGDEDDERGTEDWTNILDRGGLWHISDAAYSLFYSIEEEVRSLLKPRKASQMDEGTKDVLLL